VSGLISIVLTGRSDNTYRAWYLTVDNHHRSCKAVWSQGLICDFEMVLSKSVINFMRRLQIAYLDDLASLGPMLIHVCVNVELAVPTSS